MRPAPSEARPPYTVCKRRQFEPVTEATLSLTQQIAVHAALGSAPLKWASAEAVYISNHRVYVGAFVDLGLRFDDEIRMRGVACITAIHSIAVGSERTATLIDLHLYQTISPTPYGGVDDDVSKNRFETTTTHLATCMTPDAAKRQIEVQRLSLLKTK